MGTFFLIIFPGGKTTASPRFHSPLYRINDFVPRQIILRFSAPVVVTGVPSLKLETGTIDREALWVNTTSSTAGNDAVAVEVDGDDYLMLFEYTVVTGDSTDDLDYWSDEEASSTRRACSISFACS